MNNVSVIIISHNPGDLLEKCLKKLSTEDPVTHPDNSEWIIIDNNSNDNSLEEALRKYTNIKVIKNAENKGFAFAANQGYRVAKNEYLLYINTDVEIKANAISKMVEALECNSDISVIGPRLLRPDGSIQKSVQYFPSFWQWLFKLYIKLKVHLRENLYKKDKLYYVESIRGACFLIRKSILGLVNGFDEDFYFFCEETDLQYRLKSCGYKIAYLPLSEVVHIGGATVKKCNLNHRKIFKESYIKFLKKHRPKWQSWILEKFL